jgi:galactokinase
MFQNQLVQLPSTLDSDVTSRPLHEYCGAGRVNLIGEHIDYEGYGVLPMAIKQVGQAAEQLHQPQLF